ncbi:MAG TPA: two-component regulator propeller domain-containing protein [Prolixibacteraceae bacterium]|nr:two-component regulator propeller domain-containing protein [Prolixibacteraceae bacterium]
MNRFRELILIFILCSLQLLCLGRDLSYSRLSVEDGLSNNLVQTIYKDSYGFIWFGTLEGLDRYDGVEIRSYSSRFPETVENVYAIAEDYRKQLWVGTATGLFCHDNIKDRFSRINIENTNVTVQAFAMVADSNLFVGTTNGLYLVNTRTSQAEHLLFNNLPDHKTSNITGIFPDNHGNCWLSTHSGLIRYSASDQKSEVFRFHLAPENASNLFTSICNIGNKLYLGTANSGIVEFDLSSKTFSSGINTDNKIILTLSSDNKELLFAGTDGGGLKVINIRTRNVESIVNKENDIASISSNSIYSFFLDENDRYWIGTYSGGVNFTKSAAGNFKIHSVTTDYPEANKSIRSFYFAPDGSQYFGTRNGFIQIKKNGEAKFFQATPNNKNGLRSNIILSVFPFKGDILIGTYGGGVSLFSVTEQKIKPFLDLGIFTLGNIYAFASDKQGNLWISSFNGIYRYSPASKSIINFNKQNNGLKSDEIFSLTFDSKGRLWVGSMSGPSVYRPEGDLLQSIDLPATANNNFKTNYIYEDQAGNIWVCAERGGLTMIDSGLTQCTIYHDTDGLPDNSICSIIERSTGEYWISTLKGFSRFTTQSHKFTKYSLSDGLPGLVFTPAASYLAADGTLYFGNEKGLVYFNPSEASETVLNSKIRLTDFYISGKEVQPGPESVLVKSIQFTDKVELNERSSSIGFRFVALNYINPADNDYQYKLEGFDKEWKDNGNNTTVFYEKLKPGNYVFKVRNASEPEENSPNNAEIKIVVHHSLLSSPYFLGLLLLLALAGTYIMLKYIEKLQKAGKRFIEIPQKFEKYRGTKIPEVQSSSIINDLKRYMEEKKPYLNADLKLADLAAEINYPVNEISQVLNQNLNQSFPDFINKYRVEEVKKRMENKEFEKFTLIAIAQQCGFNSKTSFYRIFKNETGKTPADYLKDLKKS